MATEPSPTTSPAAPPPTKPLVFLGDSATRQALQHALGDSYNVLPIPTSKADCDYLVGSRVVIVPAGDNDRVGKSTAAFFKHLGWPPEDYSISPVSALFFLESKLRGEELVPLLLGTPLAPQDKDAAAALDALYKPLSEDDTFPAWLASYERKDFPMVFDDLLPAGIVGGINAEGGTGKTYLLIALAVSISTGLAFGPFVPTRPRKVLLLLAEDPEEIVKNRIHDITRAMLPSSHMDLFCTNFRAVSVRGSSGPLMELSPAGNPIPSRWAQWLEDTLRAHTGVEVLMLDPLRRFYGIEENRNDHAHAWIGYLEALSKAFSYLTILYAHHVSKLSRTLEAQHITGRGASGLSDNCRWMAAMRTLDIDRHEAMELDGSANEYIEFHVTKSNYAPRLPASVILHRGTYGVLETMEVATDMTRMQAEYLAQLLSGRSLSSREITQRAPGKQVREEMKDRFHKLRNSDMDHIVSFGLKAGILAEYPAEYSQPGVVKKVVRGKDESYEDEDKVPF